MALPLPLCSSSSLHGRRHLTPGFRRRQAPWTMATTTHCEPATGGLDDDGDGLGRQYSRPEA